MSANTQMITMAMTTLGPASAIMLPLLTRSVGALVFEPVLEWLAVGERAVVECVAVQVSETSPGMR